MDQDGPEDQAVIELLIAAMSAVCAWLLLNCIERKDPVVAGRIVALRDAGPAVSQVRVSRFASLLTHVGRRFPSGKKVTNPDPSVLRMTPESMRGAQLCGAAAGFLFGLGGGPLAIVVSPALAWAGYQLPQIWLRRRIAKRREQAASALPDAVDLLAVCTHAGLNVALSLKRVAARSRGVLGQELARTLEEIELGVPRQIAMRSLGQRNPDGDLESLVGVLENAERFGTQVSSSLENFAQEVRGRRRRSAEEQARRAPIKILFPLVFLILPAFVLLSVVPLLLSTFKSLGF
jgi:tight adherence protein C